MPHDPIDQFENFPPFKSLAIKVVAFDPQWHEVRLLLPMNAHNVNPGGTMFGGAMAALADPIAALACASYFPEHEIWTKQLSLDFIRPGTGDLELLFQFPEGVAEQIDATLKEHGRARHTFEYGFYQKHGELCCKVSGVVALRLPAVGSERLGFRNKTSV